MPNHKQRYFRQKGSALIIGLIIVLMMTLLGITTLRTTALQERMAGNERDLNVAFQSAEAGLREVIQNGNLNPALFDGSNPAYSKQITSFTDASNTPVSEFTYWTSVFNWGTQSLNATKPAGSSDAPQYHVETIPLRDPNGKAHRLYKITVKGKGASSRAEVIIQGTKYVE